MDVVEEKELFLWPNECTIGHPSSRLLSSAETSGRRWCRNLSLLEVKPQKQASTGSLALRTDILEIRIGRRYVLLAAVRSCCQRA